MLGRSMSQWVKCLPHKYKDLCSYLQNAWKSTMVANINNLNAVVGILQEEKEESRDTGQVA